MRNLLIPVLSLLFISLAARGQKIDNSPSRFNVGLNLMTLYSGIPEPQAEYFFGRNIGVFAAGGYTTRYRRRVIYSSRAFLSKISDVQGAYWKFGLKGRIPTRKKVVPWVQLLYVGSQYDESGTKYIYDNNVNVTQVSKVRNQGIAHGFAVAHGIDFGIGRHLALRFGLQVGHFKRNDFIVSTDTYQPGFGSYGAIMREQIMIGVMYRIGNVNKKVAK